MRNWQASASNWELKVRRERTLLNTSHPSQTAQKPVSEKPRAGNFDIQEAFKNAVERSYGGFYDDDNDKEG